MRKFKFIKRVEQLVKPKDIATLQVLSSMTKYVPNKVQNVMMENSSKKNPYMGFVVEPYSTFLCYELKDLEWAKKLIPDGFELIKTKIFEDGEPKYYAIFGSFNVHTSAFWGTRLEVNIIARNKRNNLLSWVIVDYDTNTMSHDVSKGVVNSTTEQALLTTDFDGNIIVDIQNDLTNRHLIYEADMNRAETKKMGRQLWLEGNLSVGYGRELSRNSDAVFSLTFNPKEVEKGRRIPLEDVHISKNTWFDGLFHDEPDEVVYFPYAQHYLSDSPGHFSQIKDEEDLVKRYEAVDLASIPSYSVESMRKLVKGGMLVNSIFVISLLVLIITLL